jgi:FkbM family methyltransferase
MSPARGGCRGELAGAGRGRPGGRARAGRGGRPGLAGTPAGWLEGVHRVATRPAPGAPALTRLPDGWWTASPLVRVRRLGLRLDLDRRDNLQQALYATGTYEPALVGFLHDELQRGDVIADVGAHTGVHALTAAARLRRLGGGAVVAFEPAHDTAARLRAAAARNRLEVTVVEAALGAEPGTADLRADPSYDAADAGVRSLHGRGTLVQTVRVITFDTWAAVAQLGRLDLVKLDVERGRAGGAARDGRLTGPAATPGPDGRGQAAGPGAGRRGRRRGPPVPGSTWLRIGRPGPAGRQPGLPPASLGPVRRRLGLTEL